MSADKRFEDYQAIIAVLKQPIVAIDTQDERLYGAAFAEKNTVDGKWFIQRRKVTPDASGGF